MIDMQLIIILAFVAIVTTYMVIKDKRSDFDTHIDSWRKTREWDEKSVADMAKYYENNREA